MVLSTRLDFHDDVRVILSSALTFEQLSVQTTFEQRVTCWRGVNFEKSFELEKWDFFLNFFEVGKT